MRCFVHGNTDAVGSCRSCGRGLCHECAVDIDKSLACRDRCESDVRDNLRMTAWSLKMMGPTESTASHSEGILQSVQRSGRVVSLFNIVLGVAMVAWGAFGQPRVWFLVLIGACFLAFGAYDLFRQSREAPPPEPGS